MMQDQCVVRKVVIAMVLQTDMQLHFTTVTEFRMRKQAMSNWADDWADVLLVLKMSMKVSEFHLSLLEMLHSRRYT
jgi:3'5'-cyclic nucleotide phosphodiesterase